MFDTNPRLPSGKELVVLELLATGREMYGLEMVRTSGRLARGTVYVLLTRMKDKGYVASRQEEIETQSGMPRQLYRITGLGRSAFNFALSAQAEFGRAKMQEGWA
jgi:DNA-binding PadR family transcriptional regulator